MGEPFQSRRFCFLLVVRWMCLGVVVGGLVVGCEPFLWELWAALMLLKRRLYIVRCSNERYRKMIRELQP